MSKRCEHITCHNDQTQWLPLVGTDNSGHPIINQGELAPHRHCNCCGLVKVEGDGRGRGEGYFYTLINHLRAHLEHASTRRKLTKTDVRLICQTVRERELFTDSYGSMLAVQVRVFTDIVLERRSDLDRNMVREFVMTYRPKKEQRSRST